MNEKDLDKKIEEHLKKETDSASGLKDETWNKINRKLFPSHNTRKKRGRRRIISGLTAAAIVAITIFGMTDTGQAMIQNVKDMFVEEKQREIQIEGTKEDTEVQLEANEELRYVIYIDDSRYKMVEGDASDRIVPDQELADRYPEVSMEVKRKENTTTEEMVESIKKSLESHEMELRQEEHVNTPIEGVAIRGIGPEYTNDAGKTGHQWDTPIHKYYITETENEQVFVIKQMYFLEAAEGHGARFDYMLESFEIVK